MYEGFKLQSFGELFTHFLYLAERKLACKHDALDALLVPEKRSLAVEGVGLGAQMQGKGRSNAPCNAYDGGVVDDERINPCLIKCGYRLGKIRQILITHECVDSDIDPDIAFMAVFDCLGNLIKGEIIRKIPERKCGSPDINGIGTEVDCRFEPFHIACRRKQLGLILHSLHPPRSLRCC